jgi:hypothetical protein
VSRFDVFEILDDGQVLWHDATSDLADARKFAEERVARTKHSFFILDQSTQRKLLIDGRSPESKSLPASEKSAPSDSQNPA